MKPCCVNFSESNLKKEQQLKNVITILDSLF